ncbi:hypothetical protein BB561_002754 [Smittium simulii]|uniref:HECT-type E3 ubiquitin transferase n=1 Tax=Smittium simulii TaxID=133385 RepID=A0A2T9YPB9_9FUNG|nr:hypothetical protein BB561_002754 [Smittium simulii]
MKLHASSSNDHKNSSNKLKQDNIIKYSKNSPNNQNSARRSSILNFNFKNNEDSRELTKPKKSLNKPRLDINANTQTILESQNHKSKKDLNNKPTDQDAKNNKSQKTTLNLGSLEFMADENGLIYPKERKSMVYSNNWGLLAAAKMMKMIYIANSFRSNQNRIENSRLLLKKLDDFDLSLDYFEWKDSLNRNSSFKQNLFFSDYSFLIGIKSKVKTLHLEAFKQMKSHVNTAFFDTISNRHPIFDSNINKESRRESESSFGSNNDVLMSYGFHGMMSEIFSGSFHENDIPTNSNNEPNRNLVYEKFKNLNLALNIRRNFIAEDALKQISEKQSEIKKPLKVKFVGEDGIDVGGLTKEFFMLLIKEMIDPDAGMYYTQPDSTNRSMWFNPGVTQNSEKYYLFGIAVGLALYNGVILDLHFPKALYKKLLNLNVYDIPCILSKKPLDKPPPRSSKTSDYSVSSDLSSYFSVLPDLLQAKMHLDEMLNDLADFNPNLASGFKTLLSYNKPDIDSVFCLTFEASYDYLGKPRTVPLLPNGENIPVTQENKYEYVQRYSYFWLQSGIIKQFEPFRRGFYYVCGKSALEIFFANELQVLISGSNKPLSCSELKSLSVYQGISSKDPIIEMFWNVLEQFSNSLLKKFLVFVTGCDRLPSSAHPPLKIKILLIGEDQNRLPVSKTCFNQLGLYRYSNQRQLKQKLLMAIVNTEGFELQ